MTLVKVEMLHKVLILQGFMEKCVSSIWNVVLYGYYMDTKLGVKEVFRGVQNFDIQQDNLLPMCFKTSVGFFVANV